MPTTKESSNMDLNGHADVEVIPEVKKQEEKIAEVCSKSPSPEVNENNSLDHGTESQVKCKQAKSRKKEDQSVDHVLRALNSLNTPEEKLAAMCKKYADLFDENRKLKVAYKESEKQASVSTRDKEAIQIDLNKVLLSRSRLENLCRELQRQNKMIKEESLSQIRTEEEKRKEMTTKFQSTINDITTMMKQDSDKSTKLRDDNIDMSTKLKELCEQYELRAQQVDKMSKQMSLENELNEAKLTKLKIEMETMKETFLKEKQQLLLTISEYQARSEQQEEVETYLRNQITVYTGKYEEFQDALTRSNDVFGEFRNEMEHMSSKIVNLESETSNWKLRWEKTQKALVEMADEKQKADKDIIMASKQINALHKLCRTLQSERMTHLTLLKDNNIPLCCPSHDHEHSAKPLKETRKTIGSNKKESKISSDYNKKKKKETEKMESNDSIQSAQPATKYKDEETEVKHANKQKQSKKESSKKQYSPTKLELKPNETIPDDQKLDAGEIKSPNISGPKSNVQNVKTMDEMNLLSSCTILSPTDVDTGVKIMEINSNSEENAGNSIKIIKVEGPLSEQNGEILDATNEVPLKSSNTIIEHTSSNSIDNDSLNTNIESRDFPAEMKYHINEPVALADSAKAEIIPVKEIVPTSSIKCFDIPKPNTTAGVEILPKCSANTSINIIKEQVQEENKQVHSASQELCDASQQQIDKRSDNNNVTTAEKDIDPKNDLSHPNNNGSLIEKSNTSQKSNGDGSGSTHKRHKKKKNK